jgi:hypothetical protein
MSSAMVKQLRAVTCNDAHERHDLAGFTQVQAAELVHSAFGPTSLPYPLPLRFTFIVGGGRLVRAKYNDDLLKWLTAALREAGFEDDRGASIGSSLSYKRQEDTDQNLVYLHVFPAFKVAAALAAEKDSGGGSEAVIAPPTPSARVISCTFAEFSKLVNSRVLTYNEKRRCASVLTSALLKLDDFESRLASRVTLTPSELDEYGELSRETLVEKAAWLQSEIKAQVVSRRLSAREFTTILGEMETKMTALKDEKRPAAVKSLEELTAKHAALKISSNAPVLPPLRNEADIRKVRTALGALDRLEAKAAGRLLTMNEAKELGTRAGLIEHHNSLIDDARGFFEETSDFELRLAAALAAGAPASKKR